MNLILRYNMSRRNRFLTWIVGHPVELSKIQHEIWDRLDDSKKNGELIPSRLYPRRCGKTSALLAWSKANGCSVIVNTQFEQRNIKNTFDYRHLPEIIVMGKLLFSHDAGRKKRYVVEETCSPVETEEITRHGVHVAGGFRGLSPGQWIPPSEGDPYEELLIPVRHEQRTTTNHIMNQSMARYTTKGAYIQ